MEIIVSTSNILTEDGCEELLKQAADLGPVGAIYNLAGVLLDGIFENLDTKKFIDSVAPKGLATKNLDKISRKLCPHLKQFIVFSSVACGRGNGGQSNYGMANSIMERIIEERHRDGLPAKAIQWGAIADVGMLAEYQLKNVDKDFGGTIPQTISSCVESLDILLTSSHPIVSSMIVADKKFGDLKKGNIVDIIFNIMGIRDKKSISMDSTLTQLGIDSLTGVEIQQIIEREFDVSLTSQELRSLTLNQLEKRVTSKSPLEISGGEKNVEDAIEKLEWMKILLEGAIDPKSLSLTSTETLVKVNEVDDNKQTKILIIPGFYGFAATDYRNIGKKFNLPAYVLQLVETNETTEVNQIIDIVFPQILKLYHNICNFILIGHSFGTVLALKIAKLLEDNGKSGQIVEIDGSPQFCIQFANKNSNEENIADMNNYIPMLLFRFYQQYIDPKISILAFEKSNNWEDRCKELFKLAGDKIPVTYEYLMNNVSMAYLNRVKMSLNLKEDSILPLKSTKISFIKASKVAITELDEDYGLSKYTPHEVTIKTITGDHVKILRNPELVLTIKGFLPIHNGFK